MGIKTFISGLLGSKKAIPDKESAKYFNTDRYYSGASQNRLRSDWITSSMMDTTPPVYELNTLRYRSRDLVRNDPVANAVIDTFMTSVIGAGLQVQSSIKASDLGISEEKATKIREKAEDIFNGWKRYADKANILNFDEFQRLAFSKILIDGEAIIIPTWNEADWRPYGRCLQMVESEELDTNWTPDPQTVNGITFDGDGSPTKYWLKIYKKREFGGKYSELRPHSVQARDSKGRPMVLHIFESQRPNQTRGIPKLAPLLDKFEELGEYLEAELVSARVSACLSVFIQKTDPITAAQAMMSDTEYGTGDRIQDIEPGVINYLAPGESINVVDPKRNESLGTFVESILRIIGMSIGMPYELLVKDFSKTNYSSARAALLEARRQFAYYRKWFAEKFCQPIYEMVLEEAYLRGELPITRLQYETKFNYIKEATWIGSPWGQIDERAETEAAMMRINAGLSTYAIELATTGKEWQDVFAQRRHEDTYAEELGLKIYYDLKGHDNALAPKSTTSFGGT